MRTAWNRTSGEKAALCGEVVGELSRSARSGSPTPTLNYNIAFDVVLVDPPWVNANILWVLEELLLGWITRFVANPLIALIP